MATYDRNGLSHSSAVSRALYTHNKNAPELFLALSLYPQDAQQATALY